MFKKNSWIVALLLALSLTVFFISCVDPLAEDEEEETYTEVALGKFNQWGGLKASQAGWAVAGIVSNEGIVAKDLGYKLEDFQKARYLVVTTSTDNPGGVDLIWASADEDGNDIGPNWMKKDGVQNAPIGSFDKATKELKIDLKKGITDKNFRAATTKKVKILLQHPDMEGWVVGAKLLIPEDKFVPVTNVTLNVIGAKNVPANLGAGVKVFPDVASVTDVKWSFISFLPDGLTDIDANWIDAPESDDTAAITTWKTNYAEFITETRTITAAKTEYDYSFLPPVKVDLTTAVTATVTTDSIKPKAKGKLKVRATVVKGGKDEKDFTKDFTIAVSNTADAVTFAKEVTGKAATATLSGSKITVTSRWTFDKAKQAAYIDSKLAFFGDFATTGAEPEDKTDWFYLDSGTAVGTTSTFSDLNGNPVEPKDYTPSDSTKGYGLGVFYTDKTHPSTLAINAGYTHSAWDGSNSGGSFWVVFKATLPATTTLSNYSGLVFTFKAEGGDANFKEPVKVLLYKDSEALPNPWDWMNPAHNGGAAAKVVDMIELGDVSSGNTFIADLGGATSTTQDVYFLLYYNVPGWDGKGAPTSYSISDIKYVEK